MRDPPAHHNSVASTPSILPPIHCTGPLLSWALYSTGLCCTIPTLPPPIHPLCVHFNRLHHCQGRRQVWTLRVLWCYCRMSSRNTGLLGTRLAVNIWDTVPIGFPNQPCLRSQRNSWYWESVFSICQALCYTQQILHSNPTNLTRADTSASQVIFYVTYLKVS